ncbi:MAG: methionyl-tRNA formyltransferase, partial [Fidelibacterota bacterium]
MRLLYFGDGLWATKSLRRLLEDGHQVMAAVLRRRPSDETLSQFAKEQGIPTVAPERVNAAEFIEWVKSQEPELNISMSYDQILRKPLIESATFGFINCHAGKLPFYRGRNVINWAIINNEKVIGITVHYIDDGIDTGDIILQRDLPIEWEDTYGTVLEKVQDGFPDLLSDAVKLIGNGQVDPQPQDRFEGTYFSARRPGDEWIDWNDTSMNIYNKIRAITHPGPGARTIVNGKTLIIWEAKYDPGWACYLATPGEVVGIVAGAGVQVKT